jgi:hypothetical protein
MTSRERTLQLRSGITLRYVQQGDPRGVPVLFLHGFSVPVTRCSGKSPSDSRPT